MEQRTPGGGGGGGHVVETGHQQQHNTPTPTSSVNHRPPQSQHHHHHHHHFCRTDINHKSSSRVHFLAQFVCVHQQQRPHFRPGFNFPHISSATLPMFTRIVLALFSLAFLVAMCTAMERRNPSDYDQSRVPSNLRPISWLLGIWRSEHDGKAMFPTIPKFTFGEQISIALSDSRMSGPPAFNYTAFAWSAHDQDELHSENGYITVDGGKVMLTTVRITVTAEGSFVTVEEGPVSSSHIRFKLVDIGRISFSRDLPVHDLVREWTLMDHNHFEARLDMETLTHGMQEHTMNIYTRVL
uniref:THAP4-like heme-binding beta-barrel domain-containing protein n=1 Tax=Globodera rostochiensis TaxID=31243 RepID=A0A914IET9_GLORO